MNEEEAIAYFYKILEKHGIKVDYSNWRCCLVDEEKEALAILEYSNKLNENRTRNVEKYSRNKKKD